MSTKKANEPVFSFTIKLTSPPDEQIRENPISGPIPVKGDNSYDPHILTGNLRVLQDKKMIIKSTKLRKRPNLIALGNFGEVCRGVLTLFKLEYGVLKEQEVTIKRLHEDTDNSMLK